MRKIPRPANQRRPMFALVCMFTAALKDQRAKKRLQGRTPRGAHEVQGGGPVRPNGIYYGL